MSESQLEKELRSSFSKSSRDHLLNLMKAAVSAVPTVGGSLSSLINDYIPSSREKRLYEFLQSFVRDLSTLKEKIDHDYINSDRFAYLFTRTLNLVVQNYRGEKLRAFRSFLVRASVDINANEDVQTMCLNRLDEMTVSHLKLLDFFGYPHIYIKKTFSGKGSSSFSGMVYRGIAETMPELYQEWSIPGYDERVTIRHVGALVQDLVRWGFIDDPENYDDEPFDLGALSEVEFIDGLLTAFGRDFLNYIDYIEPLKARGRK